MNDPELHVALSRATDAIEAPGLAQTALQKARRRRSRRRGVVAALASSALVATIVMVGHVTSSSSVAPITPSTPLPTPTPPSAPPIDPERVQPLWNPDDVAELPEGQVLLPEILEPSGETGPVRGSALAVADADGRNWVLGSSGAWTSVAYPERELAFSGRAVAIAPEANEVVVSGATSLWRRAVTSETWRPVPYPADFRLRFDAYPSLSVYDDGQILLGQYDRFWLISAEGEPTRLPFDGLDQVVPSGGGVLALRFAEPLTAVAEEWREGVVVSSIDSLPLQSLQRPTADAESIAVARARTGYTVPPGPTESDGLLALESEGLETRAFLPVPSGASYYSDNGGLTPLGWIDPDTVVVAVRPRQDFDTTWLVTWGVESGQLERVASYRTGTRIAFAFEAL